MAWQGGMPPLLVRCPRCSIELLLPGAVPVVRCGACGTEFPVAVPSGPPQQQPSPPPPQPQPPQQQLAPPPPRAQGGAELDPDFLVPRSELQHLREVRAVDANC